MEHILTYVSSVWNPYTQCNIDKIEMVHLRATRFVYNDYSRFRRASPIIYVMSYFPLGHRRSVNQMCMFYKLCKGHVAVSLPAEISRISKFLAPDNDFQAF